MRFAWLRKNSAIGAPVEQSATGRIIYIAYNVIYWAPIVLVIFKVVDYRTGFIMFFLILLIRAGANLYRNNFLTPEQGEYFVLRSP